MLLFGHVLPFPNSPAGPERTLSAPRPFRLPKREWDFGKDDRDWVICQSTCPPP